jgi:hypothetical protein
MVYALHKFRHYLPGYQFVFYVDHMALVYLVNKPQVSNKIVRWLLLFLEYEFKIVYKPSKSHLMADRLSKLPNQTDRLVYLIIPLMLTYSHYNHNGHKACMTTY